MPRVDQLPPAFRAEVARLAAAWRSAPADVRGTFDQFTQSALRPSLRPSPARLAVDWYLTELRHGAS